MTPKASVHFRRIGELLAGMTVRDHQGSALSLDDGTDRAVELLLKVRAANAKVMLVGNGGSASIAGHMELDLCNRSHVRAQVFNDPPVLTALANDYGYIYAFERLVTFWAQPGDALIAISSSGKSENILRAVRAAANRACPVITFSGFAGDNPLRSLGDLNFHVASDHYGEVEVTHEALTHFLADRAMDRTNPQEAARGRQ